VTPYLRYHSIRREEQAVSNPQFKQGATACSAQTYTIPLLYLINSNFEFLDLAEQTKVKKKNPFASLMEFVPLVTAFGNMVQSFGKGKKT
jgi:hypothetical protein